MPIDKGLDQSFKLQKQTSSIGVTQSKSVISNPIFPNGLMKKMNQTANYHSLERKFNGRIQLINAIPKVTIHLIRKSSSFLYSTTPVPAVRGNKRNDTKAFRAV